MYGKNKNSYYQYIKKIFTFISFAAIILGILYISGKDSIVEHLLIGEAIPFYNASYQDESISFKGNHKDVETREAFAYENSITIDDRRQEPSIPTSGLERHITSIIGMDDVIFQPETDASLYENQPQKINLTMDDIDQLNNINDLKSNFYIVDKRTDITAEDFNIEAFLNTDLKINNTGDPKVLIFHTHASEMYADSVSHEEGVLMVGEALKNTLENKYGIKTIHHMERYDIVNGRPQILGAYERMEPAVKKILADNPSIEVAIDLHRDGVNENVRLVSQVNNKPTAQMMFVNGLCKLYDKGVLSPISNLSNTYLKSNLAFSFHMQLTANKLFPHFTRKIYLNAFRYSLHMLPKSLLIEIGAQTNTKQEALNAVEPLAEILYNVIS